MARNKKKKYVQKDASGKPINRRSSKVVQDAKRAMMYRVFKLQNASNSLTAKEINILLDSLIERKNSTEKVKGPKPVMKYVETKLDENNVPMDGDTKEIPLSNSDITRLEQILKMKQEQEASLSKKVKEEETITKPSE